MNLKSVPQLLSRAGDLVPDWLRIPPPEATDRIIQALEDATRAQTNGREPPRNGDTTPERLHEA